MVVLEDIGMIGGLEVVGRGRWVVGWMVVLGETESLPTSVPYNKVHTHKVPAELASRMPSGVHAHSLRRAPQTPSGHAIEGTLVAKQEVVRCVGQDGFEQAPEIGIDQNLPC